MRGIPPPLQRVLLLLICVLATGCMSQPDLVRLYENASDDPNQPPVIIIHGLGGSTLVNTRTGRQVWPGSLGSLTFSDYRQLAQPAAGTNGPDDIVPNDLVQDVAGVDFYAELLSSLEHVGRFKRGTPGTAVGTARRRYYVLLYDWRKDNLIAVRKLHSLIEQIRSDYGNPNLRVDIIAHSNGGVIANYYLRYGPGDVFEQPQFTPWTEGDRRLRRIVMLGTPTLGAATSLERLVYGTRLGLRTVPTEVMATFSTPYQALPHPLVRAVLDRNGKPVDLNIYDPQVWKDRRWSVFAPDVVARVKASMPTPAEGDKAVAELQTDFADHLRRAERMQWALTAPFTKRDVEIAVFGGDCEPTPGRAILVEGESGADSRLVFRPSQLSPLRGGDSRRKRGGVDYERLMFEPGDGLVTRSSQVAREPIDRDRSHDNFQVLPISQTFFLCESHGRLTHNRYFQNNLLYFLLSR